jgi:biotin transporter BioY
MITRMELLREAINRRPLVRPILATLAGILTLTLAAKTSIPFVPVPMTLQTLATALIGLSLGSTLGVSSVVFYLILGFTVLPIFSFGGGPAYIISPSSGYLYGMIFEVYLSGRIRDWKLPPLKALPLLALSFATPYITGLLLLANIVGLHRALAGGLYPFILGDLLKFFLAFLFFVRISRKWPSPRKNHFFKNSQ